MSASQTRDLALFNLLLEYYEWEDGQDTEKRLDEGEHVNPEGLRTYRQGGLQMTARFHAPVSMISLQVVDTDTQERVQFHFLFDQVEHVLEWIGAHAPVITLDNYPELLLSAGSGCEMILLEVAANEIYEVKPPASR
ncbi:MAG: hypothetical protein SF053_05580 [Bacteroidia bacterium]|nr:hypothetical protein [Bacteroidia bacterium]